jgi:hypothetical protein
MNGAVFLPGSRYDDQALDRLHQRRELIAAALWAGPGPEAPVSTD